MIFVELVKLHLAILEHRSTGGGGQKGGYKIPPHPQCQIISNAYDEKVVPQERFELPTP